MHFFFSRCLTNIHTQHKKAGNLNSVPTVISWHRFLHAKIMWIYDIVFWIRVAALFPLAHCRGWGATHLVGAHSFSARVRLQKPHENEYIVAFLQMQRERSETLCIFFCTGRKSRNLCINMYKRWINWMCKEKSQRHETTYRYCKATSKTTNEG